MEKLKSKMARLLPQAASAVTFIIVSPPPSPRKTTPPAKRLGFSIIPAEARRKPTYGSSFDTREPSSPKVSCLGQVQSKKKPRPKPEPKRVCPPPPPPQEKQAKPPGNGMVKSLKGQRQGSRKSIIYGSSFETRKPSSPKCSCLGQVQSKKKPNSESESKSKPKWVCPPPTPGGNKSIGYEDNPENGERKASLALAEMKRFASGRGGVLSGFEWTVESPHCLDEEKQGPGNEELEKVGVGPKKEANLWKRRNKAPPPLQM